MASLDDFASLLEGEHHLSVLATIRADGSVQTSVVSTGVLDHPLGGQRVVGIVARGDAVKLRHLRRDPRATTVARSGGRWVAVEGTVELIGPDDALAGFDPDGLAPLLREVFRAAGGAHDDWDEYDRVMAAERRTVLLISPTRVYPAY